MFADIDFIKESFWHFNALCFGGKLPEPIFALGRARGSLGRMEYKTGDRKGGNYTLRISGKFDLPRQTLEDVVIHEMIHYKLMLDGYRGAASGLFRSKKRLEKPHGPMFRRMMEDINLRFGRNITVRFKLENCGIPSDGAATQPRRRRSIHNIILTTLKDGRIGITIPCAASYRRIWQDLPRRYQVAKMEAVTTADPLFDRYPSSRRAVIYKISPKELECLRGA